MNSPTVVTITARPRDGHGRRARGASAPPAGPALVPSAAVPTIGDPQAVAFAREIGRLERRIAELSAKPVHADEAARQRLARELHDHVGAELAATRFALANVRAWLPADTPPQCEHALALVHRSLDAVCNATRDVLASRHAPALDGGIVRSLSGWTRDFGQRAGLRTRFVCAADARLARLARLPADAALAVFRVAQEALANVARHARATGADLRLASTAQTLTLTVAETASACRAAPAAAPATTASPECARCDAFGGTLRIASVCPEAGARHGTTMRARCAWRAPPGTGQ